MRFLVDAQLPIALARWLTAKGFEANHVSDLGLEAASGTDIWNYAVTDMAIIVSKDEDFAQRRMLSRAGPVVVWLRRAIPATATC
jgi:predicted nuclease of predicted toxin-antitoxin system